MKVEQLHGPSQKTLQVVELEYLLQCDSPDVFSQKGFNKEGKIIVARAPARLDIMGGIADYCGANVFQMTLNRAAIAAIQPRNDKKLLALTIQDEKLLVPSVQMSLDDFYEDDKLKSYTKVRNMMSTKENSAWIGYVLGCFFTLLKEEKVEKFSHGAVVVIKSDIPMGAGIASSAAIEVATLSVINQQYRLGLKPIEIARLGQVVENRVVGAPCGIMDQVTATLGKKNKILSLLCQPDKILEYVDCPANVSFIGIHPKVHRSTKSSAYVDTRTAAFMGLTILKKELAWDKLDTNYLCDLTVEEYEERCIPLLPQKVHGCEFIEKYGQSVDTVTQVKPDKIYNVRNCVNHPVYENARVKQFIDAIKNVHAYPHHAQQYLTEAGKLMYESNASYRDCAGLGCPEIDGIVNIAQKIGPRGGIYGAKITGGGGGGTAALLCYGDVSTSLTQILSAYKLAWGILTTTFKGSSAGANEFGHIVWELAENEPLRHF
ncbi:hypothetical protein F4X73_01445 [Candidatus Poribacteria bacterium]|nr:hypothetical protein [Candidatus Poribacteria bacterium]